MKVELVGRRGPLGDVKLFEFLELGPDGFVEEEAVCEHVAEGAGGAVDEQAPRFGVVADNGPALVGSHPLLQEAVKSLCLGGAGPEEFGSEFDGPGDVAFKGADEEFIGGHAPIRLPAGEDFLEVGEETGKELPHGFLDFGAGNVLGCVEIEAEVVLLEASLHDGLLPLLAVEENEFVHVPGEKELGPEVGGLLVGVLHESGVVSVPALGRAGQLHLSGEDQLVVGNVNAQVRALPLDAFGLLDLRAPEGHIRVALEEGIRPFRDAAAKCDFVDPNVVFRHVAQLSGRRAV